MAAPVITRKRDGWITLAVEERGGPRMDVAVTDGQLWIEVYDYNGNPIRVIDMREQRFDARHPEYLFRTEVPPSAEVAEAEREGAST